jgi:hypothetical protein
MSSRPVPLRAPRQGTALENAVPVPVTVPRLRGWIIFTIAVVAAFLLLIFSRTALDRTAFELAELETGIEAAETRYWEQRLEVARLQAPDLVIERAQGLGLVYPDPGKLRRVAVPGEGPAASDIDERWAELKALLNSQP